MIFLTKEKMISYSYSFCHIITFSLKYNPTLFNHLFHLLIHRSNVETDRGTGPRKFARAHIPPLSSISSGRTLARFGHESSTHSRSFLVSAPSFAFSHIRVKPEEYHRLFCRYVNISPTFLRGFEPPRIRRLYESINSSSLSTQPLESNDASFIYHKLLYAVSPTGAVLEAYSWTIDLRAEAIID